jgi:hypothetical protein
VLAPGESTTRHEHRGPGLEVGVSSGVVRIANSAGKQERVSYSPGSYRWNGGGRIHTLTNVGHTRVEIVEIEWK